MRFLIVDDSMLMRKVTSRALRQCGLPVTSISEAEHGREALTLLLEEAATFDLILADVQMPVMDGLQLAEALVASGRPHAPLVIVSSQTSESLVKRAIAAGADGYLCKPFTPDELRAHIAPLLMSGGRAG